jgi:hypothetical protein
MGLLDSIKSSVTSYIDSTRDLEQEVVKKVTTPAKAPLDSFTPAPSGGDVGLDLGKAENYVAKNKDRDKPVNIAQIKADPDAFLKNVSQVDGDYATDDDGVSCGTTAVVMGMLASRPDSVVELSKKLSNADGTPTDAGRKMLGSAANDPKVQKALAAIDSGTFTPAQAGLLGDALYTGCGKKDGAGLTGDDLIRVRGRITQLGVSVPQMELQQFGDKAGSMGHWRVGVNGKQYNPWPDEAGKTSISADGTGLAKGSLDGGSTPWVTREKIYIDDNSVSRNVYNQTLPGGRAPVTVQSDPPLFVISYKKDANGGLGVTNIDSKQFDTELAKRGQWLQPGVAAQTFPSVAL